MKVTRKQNISMKIQQGLSVRVFHKSEEGGLREETQMCKKRPNSGDSPVPCESAPTCKNK